MYLPLAGGSTSGFEPFHETPNPSLWPILAEARGGVGRWGSGSPGVFNPTHTAQVTQLSTVQIKRYTLVPPVISTSLRWGFPEAFLQLQAVGEEAFAGNRR